MEDTIYDVIIVGAGMIGSAAARYASANNDLKVCIIGPDEPKIKRRDCARDVFGAYYDDTRITNSTQEHHPAWPQLAARSMDEYRNLEQLSAIDFYTEVGSMWIVTKQGRVGERARKAALDAGHGAEIWSAKQAVQRFPFIQINADEEVVYQHKAGYINPRKLVSAELCVAEKYNCDIIRDVVSRIEYPQSEDRPIAVFTDLGNQFQAKKVLLAPGAFIELRKLLPHGTAPELQYYIQSLLFAQVSDSDLKRMRAMPSITYVNETDPQRDCYILPPAKYRDGKYYIKIGQRTGTISKTEIADLHRQEVPPHVKNALEKLLCVILPAFTPVAVKTDAGVTTRTQHKSPYVDLLTPRIGVAMAGNGYAAKACDYIGKIAADMIINSEWSCDLSQSWFEFRNIASKL